MAKDIHQLEEAARKEEADRQRATIEELQRRVTEMQQEVVSQADDFACVEADSPHGPPAAANLIDMRADVWPARSVPAIASAWRQRSRS